VFNYSLLILNQRKRRLINETCLNGGFEEKMTKKTNKTKKINKTGKEQDELQVSKDNIVELTDTLKRIQAEFENYKKRTEKEQEDFKKYSDKELIKKLLPIIDNFELAFQNNSKNEDFIKGVELIYSQLFQILEEKGLKSIKAVGEKFDPYKHEALLIEKSNKENIVLEELQKGYTLNDRVIRHTKVKVSKK